MLYQFPPTRFSQTNSLFRQWLHLLSEVVEIGKALLVARVTGDYQHVARESEDVTQSNETFKRILVKQTGVDILLARKEVMDGCRVRGYYTEDVQK